MDSSAASCRSSPGLVEESADHRFFNSAIYFEDGEIRHVHRKVYLPTYGMFDEQRYFARGDRVRAFDSKFGRLTLLICEDLWHPSTIYLAALGRRAGGALSFGEPASRHRRRASSRRQRALLGNAQSHLRRDLQPVHDLRQPLRLRGRRRLLGRLRDHRSLRPATR